MLLEANLIIVSIFLGELKVLLFYVIQINWTVCIHYLGETSYLIIYAFSVYTQPSGK